MNLLGDLCRVSPRRTLSAGALLVLGAVGEVLAATLGGRILVTRDGTTFAWLALALATYVSSDVLVRLSMTQLSGEWSQTLRRRLTAVAYGMPLGKLAETPTGELLDRIDDDTHQIGAAARELGVRLTAGLLSALFAIIAALYTWAPAGIVFTLVAAGMYLLTKRRAPRLQEARAQEEEAWSDLAAVMEESVHGQDDIRTSLGQPHVLRSYTNRAAEALRRGRVQWRLSALLATHAVGLMRVMLIVLALGGALLVNADVLSLEALASTWLLALSFGMNTERVGRQFPQLQEALGSWTRIQLLHDVEQEDTRGDDVPEGGVRIEGLTFTYGGAPALSDLHLELHPGRSYALIGRSGSGKTTLTKVLTRAIEIPAGKVWIGRRDITGISPERLRRKVATVTQRTETFHGSVRENIALYDPELLPRVEEAIRALELEGWVEGLPGGLETQLGEGGVKLSAGEEQLLAFARVLLLDPKVVILDEATARVDPVTEQLVSAASRRLLAGRVGVLVAHRLSSVQSCDEVIVLAEGKLVEKGPLAESRHFEQILEAGSRETGERLTRHVRRTAPPPAGTDPQPSTWRQVLGLLGNERRYGTLMMMFFATTSIFGLEGIAIGYLWGRVVETGAESALVLTLLVLALLAALPGTFLAFRYFPEWWTHQDLRLRTTLLLGQTGPLRRGAHPPGEVVALSNDTERIIDLADNVLDLLLAVALSALASLVAGSWIPGAILLTGLGISAAGARAVRGRLAQRAEETIRSRNQYSSTLGSLLSGAGTLKLAGAAGSAKTHLEHLDRRRTQHSIREVRIKVWATSIPMLLSGALQVLTWSLYLTGRLDPPATLVTIGAAQSLGWFGWVVANLVASWPGARIWIQKAGRMSGTRELTRIPDGVSFTKGAAPAPPPSGRIALEELALEGFGAVHEDGTIGAEDVDLTLRRGELVLLTGRIGAGKSSLLRAVAGIVTASGTMRWNGQEVQEPERFLRPGQVGYVAQLPRLVSGSVEENIILSQALSTTRALEAAQLREEVERLGGEKLRIGHRGTRLSGGQLQRLALARALAPETELLVADDVSSALDSETELKLWEALRREGVSVLGSTSKRAALHLADRVVVLEDGRKVAEGRWEELEMEYGHLAG